MPRAAKSTPAEADAPAGQPTPDETAAPVQDETAAAAQDDPRSSETMVILPAEDEPVRCGGHVLTENGWVLEGTEPAPAEPEQEQE